MIVAVADFGGVLESWKTTVDVAGEVRPETVAVPPLVVTVGVLVAPFEGLTL